MKIVKIIALSVFVIFFIANNNVTAQKKWDVPAVEKSKANPKASDSKITELGKTEWNTTCKSCHGKLGLDDGPKGKTTKEFGIKGHVILANAVKSQTDGELFYRIKTGNGEGMPGYGKKMKDETIWGLVNYIRTLQK